MVGGHDGPAVGERANRRATRVDHRLDREDHPRLQLESGAGPAVMDDLRLFVELPADPVAAELADDREVMAFREFLDRVPDVAEVRAVPHGADTAPHRLVGDLDEPPRLDRRRADVEHPARVAMPAVLDHGDVDVDDVAGTKLLVAGDSVADDVVDRRADRRRVRAVARRRIVERRRHDVLDVDLVVVRDPVELAGGHAGDHLGCEIVEKLGREAARNAHFRDVIGRFERERTRCLDDAFGSGATRCTRAPTTEFGAGCRRRNGPVTRAATH